MNRKNSKNRDKDKDKDKSKDRGDKDKSKDRGDKDKTKIKNNFINTEINSSNNDQSETESRDATPQGEINLTNLKNNDGDFSSALETIRELG